MDRTGTLNEHVTNMAAVEKHILEAVEHQIAHAETAKHPEAKAALTALAGDLGRHVEALEAYNEGTPGGGLAEKAKEALTAALGVAAGLYNRLRQDESVSRSVRDTYTALSLANISYHMLYTTALAVKDQRLSDLALSHLKDLTPHAVELSKVVCHVVARDLAAEGEALDANVGAEAARRTHEAWRTANDAAADDGVKADVGAPMGTSTAPSGTGGQGF